MMARVKTTIHRVCVGAWVWEKNSIKVIDRFIRTYALHEKRRLIEVSQAAALINRFVWWNKREREWGSEQRVGQNHTTSIHFDTMIRVNSQSFSLSSTLKKVINNSIFITSIGSCSFSAGRTVWRGTNKRVFLLSARHYIKKDRKNCSNALYFQWNVFYIGEIWMKIVLI